MPDGVADHLRDLLDARLTARLTLDQAAGILLARSPVGAVVPEVGFYDQSHLTRHFERILAVRPARYASEARASARRGERPGLVRAYTR